LENKFIRMKTAFIITSAINVKGNKDIDNLNRLQQTLHTIDSIRSKIDNVDIFLTETGSIPLSQNELNLFPKDVKILTLNDNDRVHRIEQDSISTAERLYTKFTIKDKSAEDVKNFIKLAYLKSITEHFALQVVFKLYDFSKYDTVFKISGRYFLNEGFSLSTYNNSGITARYIKNAQITALWSFSGDYFKEVSEKWIDVLKNINAKWSNDELTDIEHEMYSVFGVQNNVSSELGVSGIVNLPTNRHLGSY
jgi:hypothetical protein